MKELEKLKYEIDLVSKGEHNQEFTGVYQRLSELDQALQFHKTFVMPCFYDHTKTPKISEDRDFSEDVFIIDEDGVHGLAYYCFRDSKWYFHTDTLVDYFEEDNETKWKWYYPIPNVDLVFPK